MRLLLFKYHFWVFLSGIQNLNLNLEILMSREEKKPEEINTILSNNLVLYVKKKKTHILIAISCPNT